MKESVLAPVRPAARPGVEAASPVVAAGCRPLVTLAGFPEPVCAHLSREVASGELRLLLRLPPTAAAGSLAPSRGLLQPRRPSALVASPFAVERSAGALWVVYALPPGPRGHRAGAAAGGAAGAPGPATLADLIAIAATVPCPHPELLALLVLAGCLETLRELHDRGQCHGLLAPAWLLLTGAPPARLLAECPRDPAVRLFGCGVAAALAPAHRVRPEEDLRCVASHVRALLATQVCEPAGEAAPGSVAARLDRLLTALQTPGPARRPTAAVAAVTARELALCALAEWDERRQGAGSRVRYAATAPRHRVGGGTGQRGARAGDRVVPAPGTDEAERPTRPVALAPRERSDARAKPTAGVPALAAGLAAEPFERGGAWLALVPSVLAGLLSLLLAVTLLLGS